MAETCLRSNPGLKKLLGRVDKMARSIHCCPILLFLLPHQCLYIVKNMFACVYVYIWLPGAAMAHPSQRPATINVCKPEAEITVFELLMMGAL